MTTRKPADQLSRDTSSTATGMPEVQQSDYLFLTLSVLTATFLTLSVLALSVMTLSVLTQPVLLFHMF